MHITYWLQLILTGLLLAAMPLIWIWIKHDTGRFRKLVWVSLFFTFDLIIFGAFTRLTDSGLGCPDWPGCYAHANPIQAQAHIDAAAALMPTGPVTRSKAWIEMIHRYWATGIGILITLMMISGWRFWRNGQRQQANLPWLPTGLFFFVCLQGAFGKWTVTMKLQPLVVTAHLLLGMGLLALMAWLAARQQPSVPLASTAPLRRWLWLASLLLAGQIALGGWVSTNYAALACTEFPMCQGRWLPEMDFAQGFGLWRELGKTVGGEYLSFSALTAIHWAHRSFAGLVLLAFAGLIRQAWRTDAALRPLARGLAFVLLMQVVSGLATIFFSLPLFFAVLHNAGAALLVLLLCMLHYRVTAKPQPNTLPNTLQL